MVIFGVIFPWCEFFALLVHFGVNFLRRLVRHAETGDIIYSLPEWPFFL